MCRPLLKEYNIVAIFTSWIFSFMLFFYFLFFFLTHTHRVITEILVVIVAVPFHSSRFPASATDVSISFTYKLGFHYWVSFLLNFLRIIYLPHLPCAYAIDAFHLSLGAWIGKEFNKTKLVQWLGFMSVAIEDQRKCVCNAWHDSTKNLPDGN